MGYLFDGGLGVSAFFVISGFLITHLILKELSKTGTLNFTHFYIRRMFRIFPAFFVYLSVIAFLHYLHVLDVTPRDLVAAGLFVFNYAPHVGSWWVGHSWSLSIEEQFYLLWPLGLFVVGRGRARYLAVGIIFIVPVVRFGELILLHSSSELISQMWEMTHTRIDTLLGGTCVRQSVVPPVLRRVHSKRFAVARGIDALLELAGIAAIRPARHGGHTRLHNRGGLHDIYCRGSDSSSEPLVHPLVK